MGNQSSQTGRGQSVQPRTSSSGSHQNRPIHHECTILAIQRLCMNQPHIHEQTILKSRFEELVGDHVGGLLYVTCARMNSLTTEAELLDSIDRFFGTSNDVYYLMFGDDDGNISIDSFKMLLRTSAKLAGAEPVDSDDSFIDALGEHCLKSHDHITWQQAKDWCEEFCPQVFVGFRNYLTVLLTTVDEIERIRVLFPKSSILSIFEIWFIQSCLPPCYRPAIRRASMDAQHLPPASFEWHKLYSSDDDGLSINRLIAKVFRYKDPTVLVIRFFDQSVFCVAIDEEWRNSGIDRWGNFSVVGLQFVPCFKMLEIGSKSVFFNSNTKQKSLTQGFSVQEQGKKYPFVEFSSDFTNVSAIEVFGCGSVGTLEAQENQNNWEKNQNMKARKVPLPGNWEENPDKALLDMAGVRGSFVHDKIRQEGPDET